MILLIVFLAVVALLILGSKTTHKEKNSYFNTYENQKDVVGVFEETKANNAADVYQIINKYENEDMSSFSNEYFDWENTPTLKNRNIYSVNSEKDISFINEEIKKQFEFIQSFCKENSINIPRIASFKLPTKRIGYSESKEICTFSFTPFTPTGRIKKINYSVNIETFPGQPEVDFSRMTIKELERFNNLDSSDEYPFGSMEFNKDFELIRATYHHWKNGERTSYTVEKKDDSYEMKKLVKQTMSDLEIGKPERIIVKNGIIEI